MARNIDIGVAAHGSQSLGAPAGIDLEELLATRLLVQGNSGSGKSHLLRRLLEQSAGAVQQIVIDPEGDFTSLAGRYGHLALDAAACERDLPAIAARVRTHRVSVVLNLEELEVDNQLRAAAQFLSALFDAERENWFPALVVVDEAQLFAPAAASDGSDEARRMSLAAMTNLMCRGRKRGLAGVIATQRLAKLAKNVAAEASNFLMGRTFLDIDMARAADLLGMERRQAEVFRDLDRGSFIGLGPAISRRPLRVKIGEVETADRGAAPKLLPLPEAHGAEALQNLIFSSPEAAPPRHKREKPAPIEEIFARIEAPPPDIMAAPPPELSEDEREAALEEMIGQILAEARAAQQSADVLFRDFQLRCRIRRLGAEYARSSGVPPPSDDLPRQKGFSRRRGRGGLGQGGRSGGPACRRHAERFPLSQPRGGGRPVLSQRRGNRPILRQRLAQPRPQNARPIGTDRTDRRPHRFRSAPHHRLPRTGI